MKFINKKLFISVFALFVISLFAYSFVLFPTGFVGTTKKNGEAVGCVCHGHHEPSDSVLVEFIGPDSVAAGQTVTYQIKLSHGPALTGGFNASAQFGSLYPVAGDTMVQRLSYPDTNTFELTHTHPKPFTGGSVMWQFRYTAPQAPVVDTLFATGNSTNNNLDPDTLDQWNFSENFPIVVYNPIGIINTSTTAVKFSLGQNYPNPFNPVTQINFTVAKTSEVKITVYDITGNEVAVPVNSRLTTGEYRTDFNGSNLASGAYFYTLIIDGKSISTKKMLMIK